MHAGIVTKIEVLESIRKKNTIICENKSVTTVLYDKPARLLL
jgi:hypothetical protein